MNKNRFSDDRLKQLSSQKELRATRQKVAVRLEILEDKFENGTWTLFNVDSVLYGLARKAAGIKGAWDSAKEIFRNLREGKASLTPMPEPQAVPEKSTKRRRQRKSTTKKGEPKPAVETIVEEQKPAPTETNAPNAEGESKPKSRRRRGGRRKPKAKSEGQE